VGCRKGQQQFIAVVLLLLLLLAPMRPPALRLATALGMMICVCDLLVQGRERMIADYHLLRKDFDTEQFLSTNVTVCDRVQRRRVVVAEKRVGTYYIDRYNLVEQPGEERISKF
jgi:hypothetical protein